MLEESSDKDFIEQFQQTFGLTDIEYRSLVSDVKSFRKKEESTWDAKTEKIADLNEQLGGDSLSKRDRFKANRKIAHLSRGIGRKSTFGTLSLQQELTRECNKPHRNEEKIETLRRQLRQKRIYPFFVVGEANERGNRFFDFSCLPEGKVVYKPYKGKKIELEVNIPKGWSNQLRRLSEMAMKKEIPVTVYLSTKYLCLMFDEEILNGFAVDEKSRRVEVKKIKQQRHPKEMESILIKDVYRQFYERQREHKLEGKIPDRCMAVDMNPTCVGFSILDKTSEGAKMVYSGMFDLEHICRKSGKSSSYPKSKYLTNKRHYEVPMVVKELFKYIEHFKCSSFVIEDLTLKKGLKSKESNRKVKTVWNRDLFVGCVKRRCNESGVELIEVNPAYTSFIGNIQHPYADACNASVEIGRRGLHKYENGGFYPPVTIEDIRTLEAKFGDVVGCSTDSNWVELYKSFKDSFSAIEFSYRLRARIEEVQIPTKSFSMNSCKSGVKTTIFN